MGVETTSVGCPAWTWAKTRTHWVSGGCVDSWGVGENGVRSPHGHAAALCLLLTRTVLGLCLSCHWSPLMSALSPQRDLDFTIDLDFKGQLCELSCSTDYRMR